MDLEGGGSVSRADLDFNLLRIAHLYFVADDGGGRLARLLNNVRDSIERKGERTIHIEVVGVGCWGRRECEGCSRGGPTDRVQLARHLE